ncbi:MAG TPA: glucosaminidase domain-containing protein [Chloroflexia bacterium]|nr:glucosaminidase domain-containing protein [Chloroflexia bacterium]
MSRAATAEVQVRVAERESYQPLRARGRKSKAESYLRVLGQEDGIYSAVAPVYRRADDLFADSFAPDPQAESWFDQGASYIGQPTPYAYDRPPVASDDYWHESYYDDDDGWQDEAQIRNPKSEIRNRLGLPGKRLPLFIILTLMAVGLVVAITPVLARGHLSTGNASMSLSNYMNGSSVPQVEGQVPIIDVRSDQSAIIADSNPKSNIENPKSGEVVGPPSISVNQIEAVLKQYGSPAVGKGQVLYDLGVKYGIDPAYALAFFVHESGCGTKGVARFTKSLGNIRTTPGYTDYEGYRSYPSWESGMEDWYKLITNLYVGEWGLRTVDAIIPVYAPWGDNNNPPSYIASVNSMVSSWRGK